MERIIKRFARAGHFVMISKPTIECLATGVPGLDTVLGGGLPESSFNLIAGQPGCGKTTLAHQIMFSLASPDRPALYITVQGEPTLKMLRHQQQFSFFDPAKVGDAIRFLNIEDETLAGDLDKLLERIVGDVTRHGAKLVFIDSFRAMMLSNSAPNEKLQQFVQRLAVILTSWQATTFLIGEYIDAVDSAPNFNPILAVADGLIWLRQSVQRNSMVRKIEISKMRGQATLPGLHSFRISGQGITVFAPAMLKRTGQGAPAFRPASGIKVSMGVPGLDAMLGGGLCRGYSLLVAGPSGSGKSILARSFLVEGAHQGETGVIAAFEQDPNRSQDQAIIDLIENDRIGVVNTSTADLSIDEILLLLLKEIDRIEATRVVIDSLSGFELTLAPTFRADFRESMLRMVTSLTAAGVTVLMTSELEDRYVDLRFSPYGTAFLTDAIIVQRYIEVESRLRRVMAVVKVRASAHSCELREYTVDNGGIQLGDLIPDQEGLLVGKPTRRHGVVEWLARARRMFGRKRHALPARARIVDLG